MASKMSQGKRQIARNFSSVTCQMQDNCCWGEIWLTLVNKFLVVSAISNLTLHSVNRPVNKSLTRARGRGREYGLRYRRRVVPRRVLPRDSHKVGRSPHTCPATAGSLRESP